MTAIPSLLSLGNANLDSLERLAIALGLFFAQKTAILPDTSPNFEAITFKIRERGTADPEATIITSTIEFECFFKLQSDAALEGGILLENIEPFFTLEAPTFPESPASLLDAPALPEIPTLANAEQLMVWALLSLNASLYPENQTYIQIAPAYGDNELKITFQFPLDSQTLSRNSYQYIAASKRIVNGYLDLDSGAVAIAGPDAYEVAVSEGYEGTKAEWLATLVGPPGPVGPAGPPGTAGAGVSWQGAWSSGASYVANDAVQYGGSSWIANASVAGADVPGVSGKWALWVSKGEPGADGAPGATGPAGEQGESGADGAPGAAGTLNAAGSITLDLVAEPATPAADKLVIYASALDGLIYKKDAAGIVEAIGSGGGSGGGREVLTGDRTYFIRTDGNDSNDGISNTSGGAFLTWEKAMEVISGLDDKGIFDVRISFHESFSLSKSLLIKRQIGGGKLILDGNGTGSISAAITNTVGLGLIQCEEKNVILKNFTVSHLNPGLWAVPVVCRNAGQLKIDGMSFGNLPNTNGFSGHFLSEGNGMIDIISNYQITGGLGAAVNGGLGNHILVRNDGVINYQDNLTVTISNSPKLFKFIDCQGGKLASWNTTFAGSLASGCTKYTATINGVINTYGGATVFPGSIGGSLATGGQYV